MIILHTANHPLPDLDILNRASLHCDGYSLTTSSKVVRSEIADLPVNLSSELEMKNFILTYRSATHGSKSPTNVSPYTDLKMPGYYFFHAGTLGYMFHSKCKTDSEQFYKEVFLPELESKFDSRLFTLVGHTHGMRAASSRFLLWSFKGPSLIYGVWYLLDGCYYSSPVTNAVPIGTLDRWTLI